MESEFSRFVRQLEKIEMETKIKKIKINILKKLQLPMVIKNLVMKKFIILF